MADKKPKSKSTPKPKAPSVPKLQYIGRKRETSVSGIKFVLNKPVPVGDKSLFEKLSKNPYFEVVK